MRRGRGVSARGDEATGSGAATAEAGAPGSPARRAARPGPGPRPRRPAPPAGAVPAVGSAGGGRGAGRRRQVRAGRCVPPLLPLGARAAQHEGPLRSHQCPPEEEDPDRRGAAVDLLFPPAG